MKNTIIQSLKKKFINKDKFTTAEFTDFFMKFYPDTSLAAIHWKIHCLKELGLIRSLSKGIYQWIKGDESKIEFKGQISKEQKIYYKKIKTEFPLIQFCVWPIRWVHEFMTHIPALNWTLIEVEKDISESVYSFLRVKQKDVYLNPDKTNMVQQVAYDNKAIIIKNLISQSPLETRKDVTFPTLEKILVDLYIEKGVFDAYQGNELKNIYREACQKYQINILRMKRYANRRNCWDRISKFLGETTKLGLA